MSKPIFSVVVTGSRRWADRPAILRELTKVKLEAESLGYRVVMAHGGQTGADTISHEVGEELGFEVHQHIAEWSALGKKAGPIRNASMLKIERPRLVLAFPLRDSIGTLDCIRKARAMDRPPEVRIFPAES